VKNRILNWINNFRNHGTGQVIGKEVLTSDQLITLETTGDFLLPQPKLIPREGASVVIEPIRKIEKEKISSTVVGIVPSEVIPQSFANTQKNTVNALEIRVLPLPAEVLQIEADCFLIFVSKSYIPLFEYMKGVKPTEFEAWVKRFPQTKQKKYREAKQVSKLTYEVFNKKELLVRSHLVENELKAPRQISMPNPWFVKQLGPYMHSIAQGLKKFNDSHGHYAFACGMDASEAGGWLKKQLADFEDPLFVMNDFSKFDQSYGEHFIDFEIRFYEYLGVPGDIVDIIKKQKLTLGRSRKGVSFTCPNTRKSGDPNTTVGNSITNMAALAYAFRAAGINKVSMLVLGDDNFMIVERTWQGKDVSVLLDLVPELLANLGLVAKMYYSTKLSDVEFCSGLFYEVGNTYILGPKAGRFFDKIGHTISEIKDKDSALFHMREIAIAFEAMKFVPFMELYMNKMMELTSNLAKIDSDIKDKLFVEEHYSINYHIDRRKTYDIDKKLTHQLFNDRYGLDYTTSERSFKDMLERITEIPAIIQFPSFFEVMRAKDNPVDL